MKKETIKTVVLSLLFGLLIVQTGVLMSVKSPEVKTNVSYTKTENLVSYDIESVFYPQSYIVSFGGDLHTGVYDESQKKEIWNETVRILKENLTQLNTEALTAEEWHKASLGKSVRMVLPFEMTIEQMSQLLGVTIDEFDGSQRLVNEILIPTKQPCCIMLGNKSTGYYLKLKGTNTIETMNQILDDIRAGDIVEYKRIDNIYKFEEPNDAIMPYSSIGTVPTLKVTKEVDILNSSEVDYQAYAVKAFGSNFDFVKKMEDADGSVVYMYGYGEKALKLGADGSIEYTEKPVSSSTRDVGFTDGIAVSLKFIENYGGTPSTLYLTDYHEYVDGKYTVKEYYFSYRMKGLNVYNETMDNGHAVEVVMRGDQVVKFKKNIRRYVRIEDSSSEWQRAINVWDAIGMNMLDISANYFNDSNITIQDVDLTAYSTMIIQDISRVEIRYFLEDGNSTDTLIPVWYIEILNTGYCFDLYTGELLNVEKLNMENIVIEQGRR